MAELVSLGKTGLSVSAIGVGTNRWGAGGAARAGLEPVFAEALARGMSFFDTAEIYGRGGSERALGSLLAAAAPAMVRPTSAATAGQMAWLMTRPRPMRRSRATAPRRPRRGASWRRR